MEARLEEGTDRASWLLHDQLDALDALDGATCLMV